MVGQNHFLDTWTSFSLFVLVEIAGFPGELWFCFYLVLLEVLDLYSGGPSSVRIFYASCLHCRPAVRCSTDTVSFGGYPVVSQP